MTFVFTKETQLTRGKRMREPITDSHRSPYGGGIFIKVSTSIQGALMCLDYFGGQTVNSLSSHKNTECWDICLVQRPCPGLQSKEECFDLCNGICSWRSPNRGKKNESGWFDEVCYYSKDRSRLPTQQRELLTIARGGFRLTKWISNNQKVQAELPETERAVSMVNLDIQELPTECALGLKWEEEADTFIWKVPERLQHLEEKGSSNC